MNKELVKAEGGVLSHVEDMEALTTALLENLDGDQLTPFDLPRVGMPTGGGKYWMLPTMENPDGEAMQTLSGVIVHKGKSRKYWKLSFEEGGGEEPDCRSDDALVGVGDPGGECHKCPKASWDLGRPPCTLNENIYLLQDGEMLPIVIQLSPTSLPPAKKFFLGLTSRGMHFSHCHVEFGLENKESQAGIKYSIATIRMTRSLNEEELVKVVQYRQSVVGAMAKPRSN